MASKERMECMTWHRVMRCAVPAVQVMAPIYLSALRKAKLIKP